MSTRDQHGAGHGVFGYDGNPQGLRHIIDLPSMKPLYQHPPCPCCGVQSWWSTSEPQACGSCKRGRVARNENEVVHVVPEAFPAQAIENPCDHGSTPCAVERRVPL